MPSYQVTLTSAGTNYNLLTLVRAIEPTFVDRGRVTVQGDAGNAADVLVGDSSLSATRYGMALGAKEGAFFEYGHLYGLSARSASAGQKLNILVDRGR